jgi:hypothetical protein
MFIHAVPTALIAALAVAATSPVAAAPAKDPVVAEYVTAVCIGSSRHPVPQSVRIDLTASAVRTSTEDLATCSSALRTVRKVAKNRRAPKGYECTATPPGPEDFTEQDVCTLTRAGTKVRLQFALILD